MNSDVYPQPADQIENWDFEADVVIAGYGIAGAAAAVEAASVGADVLVVERTGGWGGAAAMAGGFIYLGGGTGLQTACGFDDSVDSMVAFLNVAMGPGADEDRIADYCASSVDHFDWLVRCGVPFKPEFWGEPGWEPPGDEGLMFTGGENAFPFNTIAKPAPRGHVPQMSETSRREERWLHADEAARRHRNVAGRAIGLRRPRIVVGRAVRRACGRVDRPSVWEVAGGQGATRRGAGLGQLRVQRRDGGAVRAPHRRPAGRLDRATRRDRASGWARHSAPTWPTWTPPRSRS
jgi:hypothetical protein